MKIFFKYNLVKRDEVCRPLNLGGLGFRNCKDIKKVLGAKLVWRIYEDKD